MNHSQKKILFIVPPITMAEAYGDFEDAGNLLPFQGILGLAALTREKGYDTYFIDALVERMTQDQLIERIKAIKPDYVGLTATTMMIHKSAVLSGHIKNEFPNCKIFIGGSHISQVPIETFETYSEFDVGVVGEGEETLLELLDYFDKDGLCNNELHDIDGIVFKNKNGDVAKTTTRELVTDLDQYPLPAYDLLPQPIKKYYQTSTDNVKRFPAVGLIVTRGCPLKCKFCYLSVDPRLRRPRWLSIDRIIELIELLVNEHGIKEIVFLDDNLLAQKKKLRELCEKIIERKIDLTWSCLGSGNFGTEEIFRLMKKAGCWQISWGFEHVSDEILQLMDKNIISKKMQETIKISKKAGIASRLFLIHGYFGETLDTINENREALLSLPVSEMHLTYFMPLPGTLAFDEVEKYGSWSESFPHKDNAKAWQQYGFFNKPIFIPKGLNEEILEESMDQMYKEFYFRARIFSYFLYKMIRHPSTFTRLALTAIKFINIYASKRTDGYRPSRDFMEEDNARTSTSVLLNGVDKATKSRKFKSLV